jgi:hypothetical protein
VPGFNEALIKGVVQGLGVGQGQEGVDGDAIAVFDAVDRFPRRYDFEHIIYPNTSFKISMFSFN